MGQIQYRSSPYYVESWLWRNNVDDFPWEWKDEQTNAQQKHKCVLQKHEQKQLNI